MRDTSVGGPAEGAEPPAKLAGVSEEPVAVMEHENRLRKGVLTLPETLAQSVTVMAPAMSGAFITYLAAIKAGGATPLAFFLAMLACLFIGFVVSEFSLHLPSAGSLYTYTVHGLGSFWGYVTAWTYTGGLALAGAAVLAGAGYFMSLVMSDLGAPTLLQRWWLWFAIGLIGWFLLSYYDIRISTRSSLVFTSFGMAVLLLLALIVIFKGGAHGNTVTAFNPGTAGVSWAAVIAGMAFGILSFTGFETAAVLAEETKHPRKDIPRAVIGAVLIGGTFYVIVTYATSVGYGVREATKLWPESASGIAPLAERYANYLTDWVLLVVAIDAFFCGLGLHNAVTRVLYAMGRDGVLPRVLGRTHHKYKSPYAAIFTYLVLTVVSTLAIIFFTTQASRNALGGGPGPNAAGLYVFTEGLTIITPPIMLGYVLLSIAGIAFSGKTQGARTLNARHLTVSVVALAASILAVYGGLYYSFTEVAPGAGIPTPFAVIPWLVLAWIVVGAVVGLSVRRRSPETWQKMGAIFE